jgi:NAD(P)-dependent dehydrogenase (short-subunit alcohol dehydrogenase family)
MLEGKTIVVTGGAGTLGRAFASAIAAEQGTVIIADIDADAARRVADAIAAEHPGRAEAAGLDITSTESIAALIRSVSEAHGRIDAVVNNAYPRNRAYGRKLEDVTYEDFCANVDAHLGGYFLIMKSFALYLRGQGGGSIVNMSSIYGVMAPRFEVYAGTTMTMPVEYAAIKAAVVHLTRYFAQYFKKDGIRVNAVSPGGIRAAQPESFLAKYAEHCGPTGMLDANDICGTLTFLLSDTARHITGQNFIVDDGFSL